MVTTKIFCGKSQDFLKKITPGSVNLAYIDPPFNTDDWHKGQMSDVDKTPVGYKDKWEGKNGYVKEIIPVIKKIKNLLKEDGSLYIHCDHHADSVLKEECDAIFGEAKSVITWKRCSASHNDSKTWGNVCDVILFYTMSKQFTFHKQYKPYDDIRKVFTKKDSVGFFRADRLDARGLIGSGYEYEWNGITDVWKRPIESMRKLESNNLIYYSKEGRPYKKSYEKDSKGIPIMNLWDDIFITKQEKRFHDHPTKKPEALLERIIRTSSNKGDTVLDAYCGSGTTLYVSKMLGRNSIGIDDDMRACKTSANRLGLPFSEIEGLPSSEIDIETMDPFDFQRFVCNMMNARCGKKGSDGGIDGFCNVTENIVQVKMFTVGIKEISEFWSVIKRNNKNIGAIVGLSIARGMKEECDRIFRKEGVIIKTYTYDDVVNKKPFIDNISSEIIFPTIKPVKLDLLPKQIDLSFFGKKVP